ncbi:hypothetical protein [Sediminibacterium ginsengisoli]|uniref:Uncharacterized protein n=1 Tax=Sediminibacterium ginsengisoli TaxID=413434 RepID=A0A1T4PYJ1_9BACT|nr:hypothetical protein [Sediminibacterium ginsengisoli]SJZ96555.1 hypothetical protein SAMN04488132_10737 [Sediminibacterium ginsengisoli]
MKKSSYIELVLITAALASCNQPKRKADWDDNARIHIRSDSTAPYTRARYHGGSHLWYYAFRPYGNYSNGVYNHAGYYSSALPVRSNIGSNTFKGAVTRGGFGRSAFSVSS